MKTAEKTKIYSNSILKLYHLWVLKFANTFAWRCKTQHYLTPFFLKNMQKTHMDIGTGTGFYLKKVDRYTFLTLCDTNLTSLFYARKNASCSYVRVLKHNVTRPFAAEFKSHFDSISLFYLLHRLKGNLAEKCNILDNINDLLCDEGTVYGATILGLHERHNLIGKLLLKFYNRKGIFSNIHDSKEDLIYELEKRFTSVQVDVIGTVALFRAQKKSKKCLPVILEDA